MGCLVLFLFAALSLELGQLFRDAEAPGGVHFWGMEEFFLNFGGIRAKAKDWIEEERGTTLRRR